MLSGSNGAPRTSLICDRAVSGPDDSRSRIETSDMTSPVLLTIRPSMRKLSSEAGTTGVSRSITTPIGASVAACAGNDGSVSSSPNTKPTDTASPVDRLTANLTASASRVGLRLAGIGQ